MKEPQIGIEPMTARVSNDRGQRDTSGDKGSATGRTGQDGALFVQSRRANGNQMATSPRTTPASVWGCAS